MAPVQTRPLVKQLYRYYEIGNLKAILRGIVTVSTWNTETSIWDRVRDVLFPLGSASVLPAQAMVEVWQCGCGGGFTTRDTLRGNAFVRDEKILIRAEPLSS